MRTAQHTPVKLARQARACPLDGCSQSREAVTAWGPAVVAASLEAAAAALRADQGFGLASLQPSPPLSSACCKLGSQGSCVWAAGELIGCRNERSGEWCSAAGWAGAERQPLFPRCLGRPAAGPGSSSQAPEPSCRIVWTGRSPTCRLSHTEAAATAPSLTPHAAATLRPAAPCRTRTRAVATRHHTATRHRR